MEDELESPWSQLISTEDEGEVVPVVGSKFLIGRKKNLADYVISGNQHVSGLHCELIRGVGSVAYLKDVSSNGTLLNGKRITKNAEVELMNNDVITLVQKNDDPSLNVGFHFQVLDKEEDPTLSYDTDATVDISQDEEPEREEPEREEPDGGELDKEEPKGEEQEQKREEQEEKGDESQVARAGQKRKLNDEERADGLPSAKVTPQQGSESVSTILDASTQPQEDLPKSVQGDPPKPAQEDPPKPAITKMDSIEQTLICQICQEILHDCVSLQPCLHSYCAGCYSEWMDKSSACPACRNKVERISKNHIVNNLVAAFLRANPDRKRSEEDIKELDDKNKITHDMLYPKRKKARDYDAYSTSDDDFSSSDDESEASLPLAQCAQCPNFPSPPPTTGFPHPFTCTLLTRHVFCQCCFKLMPTRTEPGIVQRCALCNNHYCHLYWGCQRPGCLGCLAQFKDLNFNTTCLNGILGNAYESNILKTYLEDKNLTIKDFHQACCDKMASGDYTCSNSRVTPETPCCLICARQPQLELAYQYRKDIPSSELPEEVTRRVDCYWGKECRTQFSKPSHAQKFNHVCERTRRD